MNKQPQRIIRLITRLNIGGPARQELLLARALDPEFPSTLLAGHPPPHEGELTDSGIDIRHVSLVRPPRPVADIRAYQQIRSFIEELKPALVHTNMAKAGAIGRTVASRAQTRPRIVHTFHGHVLEGYFNKAVQRAYIEGERWLARKSDILVAVSDEVRDELLELSIGSPEQFRVIPLGFELDKFLSPKSNGALRTTLGLNDDIPLVGAIGRLARIKDLPILLRAIGQLPDIHLALLGDGEERPALEALAARLGITNRVHFLGWWMDVSSALADLDVVALSSRNEGTPVSLIEAAAAGRAVVATHVGGVPSVITDGCTGYLVPPNDPRALAERIDELLRDKLKRERFGAAARLSVVPRFTSKRLIDDMRRLYEELTA